MIKRNKKWYLLYQENRVPKSISEIRVQVINIQDKNTKSLSRKDNVLQNVKQKTEKIQTYYMYYHDYIYQKDHLFQSVAFKSRYSELN